MTLENLYLILNLGCEMIYVIDQRLNAQSVSLDKSSQVLRDLTEVLLDHKFLNYITMSYDNQMLTIQQARILMTDIACCSLMRLDMNSMDKLWELMVMIFKWQLYVAQQPQTLMDITFRHLDGIARLIPEMRKSILVDSTKQIIIDYWDQLNEDNRIMMVNNLTHWLKPFNTKISILMRLGLQNSDGSFVPVPVCNNEFYDHYSEHLGTNIYAKTAHLQTKDLSKATSPPSVRSSPVTTHEFDTLFDQLGIPPQPVLSDGSSEQVQVQAQLPNTLSLSEMLGDVTVDLNSEGNQEETQGKTLLEMFMKGLNDGQTSSSEFGDLV